MVDLVDIRFAVLQVGYSYVERLSLKRFGPKNHRSVQYRESGVEFYFLPKLKLPVIAAFARQANS